MGLFSDTKPYTAISSEADYLLDRGAHEDAAKLLNLVELVQGTRPPNAGPHEVGRLLRKRLKYGSADEQLQALLLTETLVDNGVSAGPLIRDTGLGDRLTQLAARSAQHRADIGRSGKVSRRAQALLLDWSTRKDSAISRLYSQAGLVSKSERSRQRRSMHPDDDLDEDVFGGSGRNRSNSHSESRGRSRSLSQGQGHSRSRSYYDNEGGYGDNSPDLPRRSGHSRTASSASGIRSRSRSRSPSPVNLRGASLTTTIATAHNIATRLTTAIIAAPNGSRETASYSRQAKQLRHHIVKLVHDPNPDVQAYLGELLAANEELVTALQAHDAVLDGAHLAARDDHDLDAVAEFAASPPTIKPERAPPSPARHSRSASNAPSEDRLASPPADPDDPFADDNEQDDRPIHTPMY